LGNPSVVAIVELNDRVWYSTNGGSTWADLGAGPWVGTITDINISPARADALLGRDIVVCTAVPGFAAGDIYIVGDTTTWTQLSIADPALLPVASYAWYAVKCEPNWLGGRSVVAVGFDGVGTYITVIRTSPLHLGFALAIWPMTATGATLPTSANIRSASLALPSDFDSTSPMGIVAYVGVNSLGVSGSDDVYRQDFMTTRKLEITTNIPVASIDFKGTISGGTLFAGAFFAGAVPWVYSTANPQSNMPTWMLTAKPPTGPVLPANGNIVVKMAPDYDASKTVYATTGLAWYLGGGFGLDDESSFSYSTNGGLSFNGISFIDTAVSTLSDVMPAPDNKTLFLSTSNGVTNNSLWKTTAMPPAVGGWERVNLRTATSVGTPRRERHLYYQA